MKTLIELYDERPLENVLGVEVFRPRRVVYVCPEEVARNAQSVTGQYLRGVLGQNYTAGSDSFP